MSEAEAVQALSEIGGVAAAYFTAYFSFTTAYLLVAYFAGSSLTQVQSWLLSVLYLITAFLFGTTGIGYGTAWFALKSRETTVFDEVWVFNTPGWEATTSILFVSITVASLYFMYDVRKRGKA